jgi:hypothetical protein
LNQEATTWTTSDLKFKYFTLLGGRPDGRWALPNARMKNFKFYNHTTLYDASPSLTFDGYNKLTPPVLEASFTATRLSDWDNSNQSKSPNSGAGDWPGTSFTGESDAHWWTLHNNDKCYTSSYNYGTSRDMAQLFTTVTSSDWGHGHHSQTGWNATKIWKLGYKFSAGSKIVGSMKIWQACATHPVGDVTIKYWDGSNLRTVGNQSPSGFPSSVSYHTEQEFTFDSANAQYWLIECKTHASSPNNNYIGLAGWQLMSGRDPVSTVITKGSDSYDIGTASSIYIDAVGTYDAQAKNSNTFVIKTSKVVSGSITHKLDYDSTETTINGDDLDGVDNYGQTMCGYGDTIAIAAPGEDTSVSNSGAVYIWKRTGTTWAQEAKLKSPSPGSAYYFGYAQMSMIENKIAIGEIGANKVHVFTRSGTTWTLAQTLSGSNNFGRGVALYGNHLAVGADTYDSNRGRVHIYTFTGGSPKTSIAITGGIYYTSYTGCYYELDSSQNTENSRFFELKASDGTPQFGTPEIYGFEVRRSGSTYTAYANTGGNTDEPNELSITSISSGMAASVTLPTTGQLYGRKQSNYGTFETESVTWADVFNGSYGSEVTISSPHGNTNTQFGYALSLYGTSLAVGAYADDQKAYQAGRAYIYVYDGSAWTHQASLDDDLVANDYGHEVFLVDADTLMFGNLRSSVLGRRGNASSGQNGTVYYYTRSGTTWTKHQTITASDGGTGDYFGQKIWATSDTLIVGARNWEGSSGSNRGKIYIYEKENGTWTEKKTYTKVNNALDTDYFGESVWTDGTYFVSGAMDADDKGTNSGSAHVYAKIESGPTLTYDLGSTLIQNTGNTPSQTYDNTKTITVSNIPSGTSTVGKIYKGATAYTIHATEPTSNVIIKNTGSYVSVFTTSSTAYFTNTVNVNATPTTTSEDNTIEDESTLVTTTVSVTKKPDGLTEGNAAFSGWQLAQDFPDYQSDYYWIKSSNMPNALQMWVDMDQEGGGYDFYAFIGNGNSVRQQNTANSGTALGLDIVMPRSKEHWIAMSDFVRNATGRSPGLGTYSNYFHTTYGVYNPNSGGNYTNQIMRSPVAYGSGSSSHRVKDGGRWWLRDNTFSEPNGDYTGNHFYGGYQSSFPNPYTGQNIGFNDGTNGYYTGSSYLVSTNAKWAGPDTDLEEYVPETVTTTTTTGGIAGSTAVPVETTTDTPSAVLDATDTTVTDPILDLDFTTTLPRNLKRYNTITSSSIGARFNRTESKKKRVHKSINTDTFSIELTANNASSPTTLTVTVANSKFVINGDETPTLGFIRGETYTFDQSDASNSGHPLVLATSEDGTLYESGWTTTPSSPDYVPGVSGESSVHLSVPYDVPDTIYYKCNERPEHGW